MHIGIIGLPQSGKTTVFNALTRGDQPISMGGSRLNVHTTIVEVPDSRLENLVGLFKPRKVTRARVTYADIAGLNGNAGENGLSGEILNHLTQMDGFVHVVRSFENPSVPHPKGEVDPQRDLNMLDSEFLLNDLIVVERRLEKLGEEQRKGVGRDKTQVAREIALFEKLQAALNEECPLRDVELSPDESKKLSGFSLLTRKPVLVLLNLDDEGAAPQIEYNHQASRVIALRGRLEMEITQLSPEDAVEFLQEFDIREPALEQVIRLSYDLIGLQSFFTVGPDEVRAWTVHRGANAFEAAGAIHSDLQKGFIRAEVIDHRELLNLGSLNEARSRGRLRLEGKEYALSDGEIMHVRFNV
jgi:hypothetical protein